MAALARRALDQYRRQYDRTPFAMAYCTCAFKGLLATGVAVSQESGFREGASIDTEKTLRRVAASLARKQNHVH